MHHRSLAIFLVFSIASIPTAQAQAPDRSAYAYARDSAFALPTNRSHIAFAVPQKDLLAENVAFDPRDSSFYIGSTRQGKVVKRNRDGRITDFIPSGRDGMWMVIGMKLDATGNALWVNSSAQGNYVNLRPEEQGRAAVFRYDMSGNLVKRYSPREVGPHFFNDLVIVPDGTVYITDMFAGSIYKISGGDSLQLWIGPKKFTDPNGIAASPDGRTLFIASDDGISVVDVASRSARVLKTAAGIDPVGIDGLYFYKNALIGIQGGRRNRLQRFITDRDLTTIVSAEVLEANHPMFMNPTTGVVAGDNLFYIANSQFGSFTKDGKLFPEERLFETVILRLPLN